MAKTVNVKVAKGVLLKALNEALARVIKEQADSEQEQKDYEKEVEAFKKSIPALVKSGKLKVTDFNFHEWRDEKTITISYNAKSVKFPKRKETPFSEWRNKEAQEQIKNAIRVLELSADEFVRTSSYSSVSQYL